MLPLLKILQKLFNAVRCSTTTTTRHQHPCYEINSRRLNILIKINGAHAKGLIDAGSIDLTISERFTQ